ncbi:MAG: Nramp family divalent metal transporter [Acidobacteria bacterium]|nr:Nramp family divalent metal transporter [Acidobacteriota bacterium]
MTAPAKGETFRAWDVAELPPAPVFRMRHWTLLIGPGLLMVGANIGGGEWLLGPLVTAQYGGRVLWLALLAILVQVFYNLAVMRYALYCGENIFVGFFRTPPGPRFWTAFYITLDLCGAWPYLASNAAVPLAAVLLRRLPNAAQDGSFVRGLSYAVFLAAFVPLIFGGKIYNAIERLMVAKLVLVLGYLSFIALFWVSWDTWREIWSGLFRIGALPAGDFNWATLAAFAAVAGAGGLNNSTLSSYVRDKGWGMGSRVGALPSAIGGRTIRLSHSGKVFELSRENLGRWLGWLRHVRRDQLALWAPGCVLGMVLPAMMSYEFIRGVKQVDGNAAAAMTAQAIASQHGQAFWYITLRGLGTDRAHGGAQPARARDRLRCHGQFRAGVFGAAHALRQHDVVAAQTAAGLGDASRPGGLRRVLHRHLGYRAAPAMAESHGMARAVMRPSPGGNGGTPGLAYPPRVLL